MEKRFKLPSRVIPAFVSGVAAAHHRTLPSPIRQLRTTGERGSPYSGCWLATGACQVAPDCRTIFSAPDVYFLARSAENVFHSSVGISLVTVALGKNALMRTPVKSTWPPSSTKFSRAARSSLVGVSSGSAMIKTALSASLGSSVGDRSHRETL